MRLLPPPPSERAGSPRAGARPLGGSVRWGLCHRGSCRRWCVHPLWQRRRQHLGAAHPVASPPRSQPGGLRLLAARVGSAHCARGEPAGCLAHARSWQPVVTSSPQLSERGLLPTPERDPPQPAPARAAVSPAPPAARGEPAAPARPPARLPRGTAASAQGERGSPLQTGGNCRTSPVRLILIY